MSIDIAASLNQHQRNALLSYYLGQYVPNSGNSKLVDLVQTPEDIYEYLLIDPLVGNSVTTSRVAQAMSSIQQYINGITMNMEPGYNTGSLDNDRLALWNGGASQYSIWGGEVDLDTYPENYLDPTLRQNQTAYFKALINDLNQNTITDDTAQQAVMNYLNKFEQVANLNVVSGYLNSTEQTTGTYYLLGKSNTSPVQYYWRSFDMSQNVDNVVATRAWSEWYPMNITINEDKLQGAPRLVYFNNRLYLFWFEKSTAGNISGSTSGETYDEITAYSSYCDFSNNWSAPYTLMSVYNSDSNDPCYALFDAAWLCTACGYNQSGNVLTLSLYAGDGVKDDSSEIKGYNDFSIEIDYWFNLSRVYAKSDSDNPSILAEYLFYYLENDNFPGNQKKIQSNYIIGLPVISQVTLLPRPASGQFIDCSYVLPVLNKENFSLTYNLDGSYILHGNIPQAVATDAYYKNISDVMLGADGTTALNGEMTTDSCWNGLSETSSDIKFKNTKITCSKDYGSVNILQLVDVYDYKDTINLPKEYVFSSNGYDMAELWFDIFATTYGQPCTLNFCYDEGDYQYTTRFAFSFNPASSGDASLWTFAAYEGAAQGTWKVTADEVINKTQAAFTINDSAWSFNRTLTPDDTLVRYVSFGYMDASGYAIYDEYEVALQYAETIPVTPTITTRADSELGTAVFLAFTGNFDNGTEISPIRLNTLFAKELINKANVSIDDLLTWDTQLTLEPALMDGGPDTPMDFSGANGLYFWELFFHMPWLVAYRLYQERQFAEAQQWYNAIFNPSARGRVSANPDYPEPDYWSVRPLVETSSSAAQASAVWLTTDPDALAVADPVHYQKAIFMAYVANLMAAADASYRLQTSDGLSLARLQYGQVKDLLGMRPDLTILNQWLPCTLQEAADSLSASESLRQFAKTDAAFPLFSGRFSAASTVATSDRFMAPLNAQLLSYWNTLDSRLYNLHHSLTIDGQPMTVPLYAPLVNPANLMTQSIQGGSLTCSANNLAASIPPYRFSVMLQRAKSAAATLGQLGQTLLSYCERGDSTSLQELNQQQLLDISGFSIALQQNALDALDQDRQTLLASRTLTQDRLNYYQNLLTAGNLADENNALQRLQGAINDMNASMGLITAGAAMNMAPNIFGLADGGDVWGAAVEASGAVTQALAMVESTQAQKFQLSAESRRRADEWQFQADQAQDEINQINAQLDGLTIRQQGAQTSLQLAQAQQNNVQSMLTFLTTRFTQSSLYTWLTGQLSALYYQAYDAVLSLCQSAEACWQYEMGDVTTRFIQTNAWNDSYRGLLVGETLQLNLQQMESAWLTRNQRRLELTKTISLQQLLGDSAFADLITNGTASFTLSESLFDNDYPGHYLRQIKFVTLTLPTLVGPYQDVRATLTQTSSSTLLKADINGVNYLNDSSTGNANNIVTNLRASQQVAVSSGLNDGGLFVLSFGDERYLPFEGTGAVSSWTLAFPNKASDEQQALLNNLSDVIVQVHYTALYGGGSFEQAVAQTLA